MRCTQAAETRRTLVTALLGRLPTSRKEEDEALESAFAEAELEVPLGSGCVAQCHRVRLHHRDPASTPPRMKALPTTRTEGTPAGRGALGDEESAIGRGQLAVVKIVHPRTRQRIELDMGLLACGEAAMQ